MNDEANDTKPDYVPAEFIDYGDARDIVEFNNFGGGSTNDGGGTPVYSS
ncbi:MAG: hypothetical protein J7483_07140 [Novosphingobium sp.]|nr:hypothetical protein [Novosphingobium sp.]